MTTECFEKILHDERVSEVVVVDDASTDGSYDKLVDFYKDEPKVNLYQNTFNQDCHFNKKRSVELAANEWVVLIDSDNVFDINYLDEIFDYSWNENVFYQPSFAMPHFDFRKYEGLMINKNNVANYIDEDIFSTMLNAQNMFINRNAYLDVWDGSIDPVTSDSLYFAYCWLKSGRQIFVVPNLSYQHRVHAGSHYQLNVNRTPIGFHEHLIEQLKQMS